MITFTLNGQEVQGEDGQYILEIAEQNGVEIPTLCHHKALEPVGMCRLCVVEVSDGRRTRFVTACNYPIWEGMDVKTDTEAVHQGRKLIVELLLARCPTVPVIQELAAMYDIKEPRFKAEDDDCILCGLCTRICDRMGNNAISLTGRGVDMKVDTPFHVQTDVCIACGACAFVCPTGHIKLEDITRHAVKQIPYEYNDSLAANRFIFLTTRPNRMHRRLTEVCAYILKPVPVKFVPTFARRTRSIITNRMKSSSWRWVRLF